MSHKVYVFEATIARVTGRKLGIFIPKELEKRLEKYHGKKVYVHIYVPEED